MSSERPKSPLRNVKHSEPIPIATSPLRLARGRSGSMSSASSGSASSPSELQTPLTGPLGSQPNLVPSPGSSPILSYFLSQSPKVPNAPGTFPFRKFGAAMAPPVFEEGEPQKELPATVHTRRASTIVAGRFAQPSNVSIPEPQMERGTGLLRRLSLSGGGILKSPTDGSPPSPPRVPPPSAVSPVAHDLPFKPERKAHRSATISVPAASRPRRAPSPMGERILKGHFDGFN